jgi:hypothetical protein
MISERSFVHSFDSFWHELLPLLTPRFVSLFNEAYETVLRDASGQALSVLEPPESVERRDIVAEFAFRLAFLGHKRGLDSASLSGEEPLIIAAEGQALELIQRYEGGRPPEILPMTEVERCEGLRLCQRYQALYTAFPLRSEVHWCPTFRGAGFLNSSEGDIGIGSTLIEVKTTTRKPGGRDIRQLIVYVALDASAGRKRWSQIGIFNPR